MRIKKVIARCFSAHPAFAVPTVASSSARAILRPMNTNMALPCNPRIKYSYSFHQMCTSNHARFPRGAGNARPWP